MTDLSPHVGCGGNKSDSGEFQISKPALFLDFRVRALLR